MCGFVKIRIGYTFGRKLHDFCWEMKKFLSFEIIFVARANDVEGEIFRFSS